MSIEAPPAPVAAPPAAPAPTTPDALTVPTSNTPPKPGSAREQMRKKAEEKYGEPKPEPAKPEAKKDGTRPGETTPREEGDKTPKPDAKTPETPEPAKDDGKKGVGDGWRRYEEAKKTIAQLQKQIDDSKTAGISSEEKSQYLTRIEQLEAKQKDAENELRYRAYEKSDEFTTKYEQPYNDAWKRHTADLREVPITNEDGTSRPMQPNDILDLVNLSLPDARALAKQKWGDFADDAMSARKEIRTLFENRTKALEDAKATGAEREKQQREHSQKWHTETTKFIGDKWKEFNDGALKDPKIGEFLNPVEGDADWNTVLTKGFALVDRAFAANPMDAKMNPADREAAIKAHAQVRNRAAAYGTLRRTVTKLREEIDALKKANGEFKESTPTQAGGSQPGGTPAVVRARDAMHKAGERYAH